MTDNNDNDDELQDERLMALLLNHLAVAQGQVAETSTHTTIETYNKIKVRVKEEVEVILASDAERETLISFLMRALLEFNVTNPQTTTNWYFHVKEWISYLSYITDTILELSESEVKDLYTNTGVYYNPDAIATPTILRLLNSERLYVNKFGDDSYPRVVLDKYREPGELIVEHIPQDLLVLYLFENSYLATSTLNVGISIANAIENEFPETTPTELRRVVAQSSYILIFRELVLPHTYDLLKNQLLDTFIPAAFHSVVTTFSTTPDERDLTIDVLSPHDPLVKDTILLVRSVIATVSETLDDTIYELLIDDVFKILGDVKEIMNLYDAPLPEGMVDTDFNNPSEALQFFRLQGLNTLEYVMTNYTKAFLFAMREYYNNPTKILSLSTDLQNHFANYDFTNKELDTITIYAGWNIIRVLFEYTLTSIKLQACTSLHTMLYGAKIHTELGFTSDDGVYYSGFEIFSGMGDVDGEQDIVGDTTFEAYMNSLDDIFAESKDDAEGQE